VVQHLLRPVEANSHYSRGFPAIHIRFDSRGSLRNVDWPSVYFSRTTFISSSFRERLSFWTASSTAVSVVLQRSHVWLRLSTRRCQRMFNVLISFPLLFSVCVAQPITNPAQAINPMNCFTFCLIHLRARITNRRPAEAGALAANPASEIFGASEPEPIAAVRCSVWFCEISSFDLLRNHHTFESAGRGGFACSPRRATQEHSKAEKRSQEHETRQGNDACLSRVVALTG